MKIALKGRSRYKYISSARFEGVGWSVGVAPLTLTLKKDGLSIQIHAPTVLRPKNESSISFEQEAWWVSKPVLLLWRRDSFLDFSRN